MTKVYPRELEPATNVENNPRNLDPIQYRLAFEPRFLYQPEKTARGRFALCSKGHNDGKFRQDLFDFQHVDVVMRNLAKMPDRDKAHHWISQNTLTPWARNREISSIMLLNAVWVDIDLSHPPVGYRGKLPQWNGVKDADRVTQLLLAQMKAAGMPTPSLILFTGGGVCIKFVFENALPAVARPRWQSVQEHLCRRIAQIGDHGETWPVDFSVCEASRILRMPGTHNPRWNAGCYITFASGERHDFDLLADQILPYSREQAREYQKQKLEWQQWDKNRAAAMAVGVRQRVICPVTTGTPQIDGMIDQEAARGLWSKRLAFGLALVQERGGIFEGERNNLFWPMANAMAYSCTSVEDLNKQIAALHQDLFSGKDWTRADAIASAKSVLNRLKTGRLYKMTHSTFMQKLRVTGPEKTALGHLLSGQDGTAVAHNAKKAEWNIGAMGFERMRGLTFDAYLAETRRRQAEAGRSIGTTNLTTSVGQAERGKLGGTAKGIKNEEKRLRAGAMRLQGMKQAAIAYELGVSQKTVSNWLNTPCTSAQVDSMLAARF